MAIRNTNFADRVLDFYSAFDRFAWTEGELALVSPIGDARRRASFESFCRKFYSDNNERVFCLGINPSRVRDTSTGVPYTDGYALENICKIPNDFNKSRELSAIFFNLSIEKFGGAEKFYATFYPGATFPLSILNAKKYCNYYDSTVPNSVRDMIPNILEKQCEIGSNGKLIIIGSGENSKILQKLNSTMKLFNWVKVLEHPRYIMQYKSKDFDFYLEKYIETFREAIAR